MGTDQPNFDLSPAEMLREIIEIQFEFLTMKVQIKFIVTPANVAADIPQLATSPKRAEAFP